MPEKMSIAGVLPNPEGEDQAKESVTLTNQGATSIDLTGWKPRDRAGGEAPLSDQLATGASKTIILPRALALNNNGDEVALIGSDGIERVTASATPTTTYYQDRKFTSSRSA